MKLGKGQTLETVKRSVIDGVRKEGDKNTSVTQKYLGL
jgi:hypothetical protein